MNKHILVAMDRKNRTQCELRRNVADAADTAAAYFVAYVAAAADDYVSAEHWINEYFEATGENKQDYIDEINKDNKK